MKIYAYVIIVLVVTAGLGAAAKFIHDAGYDKRDAEIRDDAIIAQNAAIEKRMVEWVETQAQAKPVIVIEEKIVEKIREVEKRIPFEVEKIVTVTPECADLGSDYAGLLNAQISASNTAQDSIADPAAIVAPGLP